MARFLRIGAALAVGVAFVIAIKELRVDSSGGTGRPDGLDQGITLFEPSERTPLPILDGTTLDGSAVSTEQSDPAVLVVNVWGSWCPPCRVEMPSLVRISERFGDRGVSVLGINTRDNADAARAFVRRFSIGFPNLVDEGGELTLRLSEIVPANAVPSTLIIDRDGLVAARVIGPITDTTLRNLVEDTLEEAPR